MTHLKAYPKPKITKIEWTDNPRTFEEYFGNLKLIGLDILIDRQSKYGPENIRQGGLYGLKTRIGDKFARLAMALQGRIVDGEVVIDKVAVPDDERPYDGEFDLANYAEIQIAYKEGDWAKYPLAEKLELFEAPTAPTVDDPLDQRCPVRKGVDQRCIVMGRCGTHTVHEFESIT